MKNKIYTFICAGLMCGITNGAMAACAACDTSAGSDASACTAAGCKMCANGGCYICCAGHGGDAAVDPLPDDCMNSDWADVSGKTYQSRTTCVGGAAVKSYRCKAGYYGPNDTSTIPTCTECPSSGGIAGMSAAGSTAITSCYIPGGSAFTDEFGSGTYTSDCYWTE